jgi:L-2-hydroxyglutarate oxidase LhgO
MDAETIVIGAGVIGLAVARRLAALGQDVLVIEESDGVGQQTSSRNSEVVHAGIYYAPGSLKARLCVAGRAALYEYCASRGVPAKAIGKLIVATSDEEIPSLRALQLRATKNGVNDLVWLDRSGILALEPELSCEAALFSPSSGIVDSHAFMLALQGDAENNGATFAFRAKVSQIARNDSAYVVKVSGEEQFELTCRNVVNCAGLGAQEIARNIEGYAQRLVPPRFLAKGNYFSVSGATPFTHLIYPMPANGGLGVHVTLDLSGRMRLGPDIHWVDEVDYAPDMTLEQQFSDSVATFWPEVRNRELSWTYSGVRPKVTGPGSENADFVVAGPDDHGMPGLVCFFGIESPGLTASLALADLAVAIAGWR